MVALRILCRRDVGARNNNNARMYRRISVAHSWLSAARAAARHHRKRHGMHMVARLTAALVEWLENIRHVACLWPAALSA